LQDLAAILAKSLSTRIPQEGSRARVPGDNAQVIIDGEGRVGRNLNEVGCLDDSYPYNRIVEPLGDAIQPIFPP